MKIKKRSDNKYTIIISKEELCRLHIFTNDLDDKEFLAQFTNDEFPICECLQGIIETTTTTKKRCK
jgi:hypothetical protein